MEKRARQAVVVNHPGVRGFAGRARRLFIDPEDACGGDRRAVGALGAEVREANVVGMLDGDRRRVAMHDEAHVFEADARGPRLARGLVARAADSERHEAFTRHAVPVPRMILAAFDLGPCGQRKAGHRGHPRFHPPAVLVAIGANDFDVHPSCTCFAGNVPPRVPAPGDRVARIRHDARSDPQAVSRHPEGQRITFGLDRHPATITSRLLDGVNANIGGSEPSSQRLRERRFPAPRKARKDEQHGQMTVKNLTTHWIFPRRAAVASSCPSGTVGLERSDGMRV